MPSLIQAAIEVGLYVGSNGSQLTSNWPTLVAELVADVLTILFFVLYRARPQLLTKKDVGDEKKLRANLIKSWWMQLMIEKKWLSTYICQILQFIPFVIAGNSVLYL